MDEGPFRMPRPAAARTQERRSEPAPVTRQSQPVPPSQPQPASKPAKRSSWPAIVVIILVIVGLAAASLAWLNRPQPVGGFIDSSTYQAVFSANGQVYFGKLEAGQGDELRLSEVYYVQTATDTSSSDSSDLELIKLGSNEVYGPRDEMVFIKDQVLYYENLDPDGKVSNLIRDNQGN